VTHRPAIRVEYERYGPVSRVTNFKVDGVPWPVSHASIEMDAVEPVSVTVTLRPYEIEMVGIVTEEPVS
jgi:hypothetical protein